MGSYILYKFIILNKENTMKNVTIAQLNTTRAQKAAIKAAKAKWAGRNIPALNEWDTEEVQTWTKFQFDGSWLDQVLVYDHHGESWSSTFTISECGQYDFIQDPYSGWCLVSTNTSMGHHRDLINIGMFSYHLEEKDFPDFQSFEEECWRFLSKGFNAELKRQYREYFPFTLKDFVCTSADQARLVGVLPVEQAEDLVAVQYHGLCAYSGHDNITEKAEGVLNGSFVFCGSDRAIGAVGLVFDGVIHKAFSRDCWSKPEERDSVDRSVTVSEETFFGMSSVLSGKREYIETWTIFDHAYGLWCEQDVPQRIKDEVKILSEKHNIPIFWGHPERIGKFDNVDNLLESMF